MAMATPQTSEPLQTNPPPPLQKGIRYKVVYMDKDVRVISGPLVDYNATHVWIRQNGDEVPTGIALSVIRKIEPQEH
jgi:hypothetical protein